MNRLHLVAALSVVLSACGARAVAPLDGSVPLPDAIVGPDVVTPPDAPVGCAPGQTLCSGVCRDLSSDPNACGDCRAACSDGARCVNGRCETGGCPRGQTVCGVRCFDLQNDAENCGGCFMPCAPGVLCRTGRCQTSPTCPPGQTLCSGACVDPNSDRTNCGRCGNLCADDQTCTMGTCFATPPPPPIGGPPFRIVSINATRCRATEHEMATGDDRGGIALVGAQVLYSGDRGTGLFDAEGLLPLRTESPPFDGLTGNLGGVTPFSAQAYVLGERGVPVANGPGLVTELLEIHGMGGLSGARIPLSAPIALPRSTMRGNIGLFAGRDRVVILTGARAFHIELPSGAVTDLGAMAFPTHTVCENFAVWGTAEYFGGQLYVDYVRDNFTIVRTRVPDGATETVGRFANLSDMCSFTVDPARGRWYFHHEGTSQFRTDRADETLGYCDAEFAEF